MGGQSSKTRVVSVRLENDVMVQVEAEAKLRGRPPSYVIKQAIDAWLSRQGVSGTRVKT